MNRIYPYIFVIIVLSISNTSLHAEVLTIEATVKSVDTKSRSITVERKGKIRDLDVSRKVKIIIDGEQSSLDALKQGQTISLSYHTDLEIVLKIDANSSSSKSGTEYPLFNGNNLDGWSLLTHKATKNSNRNTWIADPDRKVLASLGEENNELRTDNKFKDFDLNFEWRFTPGRFVSGNGSDIVVRSNGLNSIGLDPRGIEIDIRPKSNVIDGTGTGCFTAYSMPIKNHLNETQGEIGKGTPSRNLGWLKAPKLKPSGQWNETVITCKGDRITVEINGILVNEGWGVPEEAGHICLRNQRTSIEYRNISITTNE